VNDHGMTCARTVAVFAALLVAAVACSDYVEVRSVIEWDAVGVEVTVPDYFEIGVPAPVSVLTYAGGCDQEGRTDVTVAGLLVIVEPYYLVPAPGASLNCPSRSITGPRTAYVTVNQAGDVTVRIVGWTLFGDSVITVERTVPAALSPNS